MYCISCGPFAEEVKQIQLEDNHTYRHINTGGLHYWDASNYIAVLL